MNLNKAMWVIFGGVMIVAADIIKATPKELCGAAVIMGVVVVLSMVNSDLEDLNDETTEKKGEEIRDAADD